ncbi:MAG: cobyrinate a,c-diamide synthase [Lachnospiraceae bacterium]|nr:cobyrinate a,c-diamide synthase [Lachnospiraceae bacterium]
MKEQYSIPRCMIAAAGSGSGKTTVTVGLIGALKKKGFDPVSFKCGPDYIDPMFHRRACGIDAVSLDTFFAGEAGVRRLVAKYASAGEKSESRYAVIEGVMGIYDGMKPDSLSGSCYEIASVTKTPIILTVDASGVGRTVIPLIKGILADDDKNLIKGIIFNRMSDAFYEKIYPVIKDELAKIRKDVGILGHIPKKSGIDISSRHLGLKMPDDVEDITEKIRLITQLICEKCDIDAITGIMTEAGCIEPAEDESEDNTALPGEEYRADRPVRLAVAKDEAFCFYYTENLNMLMDAGVEPVYFSPVHDAALPDNVSGLLFGGGYPELYLNELSSNTSMLASIREAMNAGMPCIAECGGFMYLHKEVEDVSGAGYELVGAIDGRCTYTGHLVNFGYVEVAECDKMQCLKGMRGHEFHYYDSTSCGSDALLEKPSTGRRYRGMIADRGKLMGFAHLYYRSAPEAVFEFVKEMERYGN